MRHALAIMVALASLAAPALGRGGNQGGGFPHRLHDGLFSSCEDCHAGIPAGDAATAMPPETVCLECHNGTDMDSVPWRPSQRGAGLLRFSHPSHVSEVDSADRACATCHGTPDGGGSRSMDVGRARPDACLGCHSHRASTHLAEDNRCAACHIALTSATGLSAQRISALPKPATHEQDDFVATHKPATQLASASCAVCHARESCERCHVNASTQSLIVALGRDTRVASLVVGRGAVYPVPADHQGGAFGSAHGEAARAGSERCASCHARASCATCHIGSGAGDILGRMPVAERGGAPGVGLRLLPGGLRSRPPVVSLVARPETLPARLPTVVQVHEDGFRTAHRAQAASGSLSCQGCHGQQFCSDCHAGENQRRFHPSNFTQRHAADSYGRETECASCHNAEVFCRSCHRQSGLASKGRLDAAFHNAQPLWLLQHGRAARQGLQSCTTCHQQRDCLACHSTIGWGVNPHGPGFRADRLADRNATQCLMCHLKVPGRN